LPKIKVIKVEVVKEKSIPFPVEKKYEDYRKIDLVYERLLKKGGYDRNVI
jgi:hypothetical protein